jgi:hypothetical protein
MCAMFGVTGVEGAPLGTPIHLLLAKGKHLLVVFATIFFMAIVVPWNGASAYTLKTLYSFQCKGFHCPHGLYPLATYSWRPRAIYMAPHLDWYHGFLTSP